MGLGEFPRLRRLVSCMEQAMSTHVGMMTSAEQFALELELARLKRLRRPEILYVFTPMAECAIEHWQRMAHGERFEAASGSND